MKYQLPPLAGLRAFEAAARTENFARAADELNLSQATVSHRVRMLEKHLGYTLFQRLPRGLKLTEAGKAYVPAVRNAFEQLFASTAGIFGHRGTGSLTVRAPLSYSALWLAPMIDGFMTLYPGIEVRLISSVWADDQGADEPDIDLRLGYGNWENCHAELLINEAVLPVCRPTVCPTPHSMNLSDLVRYPLIHVMGIEDLWMKFFAQQQLVPANTYGDIHVDSVVAALEIATHSPRIALLQERFIAAHVESGRLVIPLNKKMAIDQAIYWVTRQSGKSIKPEAILFREWLSAQVAP